jgi:hypothetical protein
MCFVWISEQTAINFSILRQLIGFYKRDGVFTARYGLNLLNVIEVNLRPLYRRQSVFTARYELDLLKHNFVLYKRDSVRCAVRTGSLKRN